MDASAAAEEVVRVELESLECRFYEKEFPDPETLVTVNVKQIAEMGAYVSLLEYGNISTPECTQGRRKACWQQRRQPQQQDTARLARTRPNRMARNTTKPGVSAVAKLENN